MTIQASQSDCERSQAKNKRAQNATRVQVSSVWWGTRWRGTPPTWGGLGWLQQGQWHQHRQEEEVYPLPFCCVQSSCWMLPKGLRVQQEEVYPLTFCCVHCTELLLYPLTFCCGRQASRQKCTNWKNGSIYSLFAQADTLIKSSNFFWTPCCS